MKSKKAKHGQTILAYVVLILLSFLCMQIYKRDFLQFLVLIFWKI